MTLNILNFFLRGNIRSFSLWGICHCQFWLMKGSLAEELNMNLSAVKNKLYRTIERQKKKFRL